MNRTLTKLFIATLCLFTAVPAFAGHGWILDRLDRQHTRIERGIDSGELTRREARRLKKQQRRIHRLARELSANEQVSRRERRILTEKLNRASDRIYELKHNDAYRRSGGGHGYRYHGYDKYRFCID